MHGNNDNQRKSDRVVKGGGRIDLSKIDPKYIDDYRDRFKERDEERARRNNPSNSASGWNKGISK